MKNREIEQQKKYAEARVRALVQSRRAAAVGGNGGNRRATVRPRESRENFMKS